MEAFSSHRRGYVRGRDLHQAGVCGAHLEPKSRLERHQAISMSRPQICWLLLVLASLLVNSSVAQVTINVRLEFRGETSRLTDGIGIGISIRSQTILLTESVCLITQVAVFAQDPLV